MLSIETTRLKEACVYSKQDESLSLERVRNKYRGKGCVRKRYELIQFVEKYGNYCDGFVFIFSYPCNAFFHLFEVEYKLREVREL